jgi:glycosyltransferase involved in cell wall biosynthesis
MVASAIEKAHDLGWEAEAIFARPAAGTDWHSDLRDRGLAVRTAPAGTRLEVTRWARDLAREFDGPTIVHTHFTRYDVPMALAVKPGALAVVWHEHSALSDRPDVIARNVLKFELGSRRVRAVICPAPDLAEAMIARGARAEQVHFVPNGIDAARFPLVDGQRRSEARKHLGIHPAAKVALSLGWHWQIKGGELFQRAIAEVASRSDAPVVALHTSQTPEAERLVGELGLDGVVRLIGETDDVPRLMAAADVFVSASRAEGGTPLAVLEALASGLPVVATDLPAHRYVADSVPGVQLVPQEVGPMAAAISQAIGPQASHRRASGAASHEAVESHFSFEQWCDALFEVYDQVALTSFDS